MYSPKCQISNIIGSLRGRGAQYIYNSISNRFEMLCQARKICQHCRIGTKIKRILAAIDISHRTDGL